MFRAEVLNDQVTEFKEFKEFEQSRYRTASRGSQSTGSQRKRTPRAWTAEFKQEAVRLMQTRRAAGVSVAQVGRELDVRPDQLRRWAHELNGRRAAGAVADIDAVGWYGRRHGDH